MKMKTNYLTDKELSALIRHYNSLPNVSDALKAIHSDITSSNSINYENLYKNLFQSIKSDFSGVVPNELQGLLENLNEKALKQNNTKNKKIIDDSRDFSFNDLKQTTIKKYLLEIDYLTKMIEKDENSLEISSSDFNKSVIQNRLEEAKYLVESHREKINSIRSITSFRGTNGLLNALQGLGPIEKAKTTPLRISLSVRNRITKLFIEKGIEKASSKTIELENELADISAKLKNPNTINIRELKQKQAYLKRQRTYSLIKEKKLNEKEGRMLQSQRRIVDHMIARNLRFSQDFRLSEGKSSDRLY